ncbi:hypothetical protein T459_28637 [Capsicum annuum]|uniref:Uncharacterized protein n=1 Tax=Capsicum annuum TaxID=4072 RepID=A0A2G2YHF3_CAPAN|nr:hypothetical protein T459_28637 [Capsicum annuum]
MPFLPTLRSVQTLPDPKVVDGIKIEFFGATIITRKIILEGGLVAVDDGSRSGGGSSAAVGATDAPLTIFETTSHYDYDHTGCADFSPDFAHLTNVLHKMTSKRDVIPSKRISYPYTLLEIKAAKRRRKDTFKASSIIEKSKIAMPLSLSCTDVQCARATGEQYELKKVDVTVEVATEEHNIIVDNPSSASKEDEKVELVTYRVKMDNPFYVQYVEGIAQQTIGILNCEPFVIAYVEYLSNGLQVPNDGLDAGLLRKRHASLLWKYGEAKAQKPYPSDIKDPR